MFHRLVDMPTLASKDATVEAPRYNRVRLALLRLGSPLRIGLPELRGLDMVLDEESWVCVDRSLNDLPVIAWLDFRTAGRDNLYQPIPCRTRYYHRHAGLITQTALSEMDREIETRLRKASPDTR